jgi:hypothetical protein
LLLPFYAFSSTHFHHIIIVVYKLFRMMLANS